MRDRLDLLLALSSPGVAAATSPADSGSYESRLAMLESAVQAMAAKAETRESWVQRAAEGIRALCEAVPDQNAQLGLVMDELAERMKAGQITVLDARAIISRMSPEEQIRILRCGSDACGRLVRANDITTIARMCLMSGGKEGVALLADFKESSQRAHASMQAASLQNVIADASGQALRQPEIPRAFRETAPTRDDFIAVIGRQPRDDVTFFGFVLMRRDSTYKQVLGDLEGYARAVRQSPSDRPTDWLVARPVDKALAKLVASLEKHVGGKRNPEREAMGKQLQHYKGEQAMLKQVLSELRKGEELGGDNLADARARMRMVGAPLFSLAGPPGSPFTFEDAVVAMQQGLSPQLALTAALYQLPLTMAREWATAPANHGGMTPFGSGAVHTVYAATVKLPNGEPFDGIFKGDGAGSDFPLVATEAGISAERPNWGVRNAATYKISQLLGLGLVPPTHLVVHGAELGSIMKRADGASPMHEGDRTLEVDEGLAHMLADNAAALNLFAVNNGFFGAKISGTEVTLIGVQKFQQDQGEEDDEGNPILVEVTNKIRTIDNVDFSDAGLRRELTQLQWLDALTAQGDRHAENYFVWKDAQGKSHVCAIDNDQSFGKDIKDCRPNLGKLRGLPRVIDSKLANKLLALAESPEGIEKACEGLSPDEVEATKLRLAAIAKAIRDPSVVTILESDDDWAGQEAAGLLGIQSLDHITEAPDPQRMLDDVIDRAERSGYLARDAATQELARLKMSQGVIFFDPSVLATRLRAAFDAMRGGLSPRLALLAADHDLPAQLALECATHEPKRDHAMKPFGQGQINTVYEAQVRLSDGTVFRGIYKKDNDKVDASSLAAGISKKHPHFAVRNLVTWKLNQRLKLNVIPPTHLVVNGGELGCIMAQAPGLSPMHSGNRKLEVTEAQALFLAQRPEVREALALQQGFKSVSIAGSVVTLENEMMVDLGGAKGSERMVWPTQSVVDFSGSSIRRELTRLQWLDALTGQCDRHAHNYFVEPNAQCGVQVWGVDNDMSLGEGLNDPDLRPGIQDASVSSHSSRLPDVIDEDLAEEFLAMTSDELAELCVGLSAGEIAATQARLAVIKSKIEKLKHAGRVLPRDADWSTEQVGTWLGIPKARDFDAELLAQPPSVQRARAIKAQQDRVDRISLVARETASQLLADKYVSVPAIYDPARFTAAVNAAMNASSQQVGLVQEVSP